MRLDNGKSPEFGSTTTTIQDSRHLVEVKPSAPKGLGVFAKADILRGTRVIAESALLQFNGTATDAKEIVRAFDSLPIPEQTSYLELHGYACDLYKDAVEQATRQGWYEFPELHRKVLAIYAANSFNGVFLLGSRINHSCIPNIDFAYNRTLEKETFHAVRDIIAGEELTITYIKDVNRTRIQRQSELDKWGFRCTCPACRDTAQGRRKEKRHAKLFSLDQDIAIRLRFGAEASWREALNSMQKLAALQKSEGLLNRALSVTYNDAARLCMALGDTRMALLWAQKELELDRVCVGEDHPDYETWFEVVGRLRAAVESSKPVDESIKQWFLLPN